MSGVDVTPTMMDHFGTSIVFDLAPGRFRDRAFLCARRSDWDMPNGLNDEGYSLALTFSSRKRYVSVQDSNGHFNFHFARDSAYIPLTLLLASSMINILYIIYTPYVCIYVCMYV